MTDKIMQPTLISHAGLLLVVGVAWYIYKRVRQSKRPQGSQSYMATENAKYLEENYYSIEPLSGFDLAATEPIKIRPFKPRYHLTMALENMTISDLVAMDNTYTSRIALRRNLISTRPNHVLALNPVIEPSVLEFYTWIMSIYLPGRFPTVFERLEDDTGLKNLVTDEIIPWMPVSAYRALEIMGGHVDDDFLFLLPTAEEGKYRLEGFVTCFPSGFDTTQKLGLTLTDIHAPVPGYKTKLEKSMDRFFAALPVGRLVKRVNWSITTHGNLFCLSGNHTSEEEAKRFAENVGVEKNEEDWTIENAVLRCERQTLHRLPGTKALVFAFKTYQYGLGEVREEGSGEELAQAIEGLGEGSVPRMRVYKSAVVWGDRVKAFLRMAGEEGRRVTTVEK